MGNNVHDKLFKSTFSQVEHVKGEIQRMLPPAIVARMDFATLTRCPGSFVDEALKERHTDLLFSVSIAGRPAYIYILCEHQSTVDVLMAFRLLCYLVRVWQSYLAEHPDAKLLPAIIPLVVHHSERGWTAATAFEELFDLEDADLATVAPYVPRFKFLLDDLSLESDEALRARPMTAVARLVLWCLRSARDPERILQGIRGWTELIREVQRAPNGAAALILIWLYIFAVETRHEPEELLAMLTEAVGNDGTEELLSVADKLIQRGREQERKQGLEHQRKMVLKLLAARFGALPEAIVARVNAAEPIELDLWFERGLTAPALADVLADT